ncbi:MAG TPA: MATE family efflux transporter [Halanaerobiales bacterium]|nr:MATE family efflux transporter [Halanaerobiales bacterium]
MELRLTENSKIRAKKIFILALPAILEMSLNTMLGVADTLMISRIIGKEGLAAVGFANQIFFTLIFIFSSFNAGATAMIARSYGERNYKRLNKIMGQNLTLNTSIGLVVFFLTFIFAGNILSVYDITPQVKSLGVTYLKIVAYSQLFMFISFAMAASLRGAGDTKTPMYITGSANILNIIGNYVLMTGFWIFPDMGIAGAALSTTISRILASIAYIFIVFNIKEKLQLKFENLKLTKEILQPLWNFSYAAGLEQLSMQLAFFLNGIIVSMLTTTSEAAFRILINIESISFMPAIGTSIATATLVGKHLGENRPEESLKTGFTAAGMGVIWGLFMGIIFLLFPEPIIRIFTTETVVVEASLKTLRIAGINQAPLAFMIIMAGALRGTGDTKGVMIITAMRLWLMFVPLTYLFTILLQQGVTGVWYAEISSFVVFSFVIFKRFKAMEWTEIRMFA